MKTDHVEKDRLMSGGPGRQSYARQRLRNFGATMTVMGGCFVLYYLGLFGNQHGPLTPARLGAVLAGLGVTRTHVMTFFVLLLAIALSWNWVYNFINQAFRSWLARKAQKVGGAGDGKGPLNRGKGMHHGSGRTVKQPIQGRGRQGSEVFFRPVKKGAAGHALWVIMLCFCILVFFIT